MGTLETQLRKALPFPVSHSGPRQSSDLLDRIDPPVFWSAFLHRLTSGKPVALADPAWPQPWRDHFLEVLRTASLPDTPAILIPTSGTSGRPRFCLHTPDTFGAAADGFAIRFGHRAPHAVVCLPLNHVGGLLPVFRSARCGGRVHFANYRDGRSIIAAPFRPGEASISLVPAQLRIMLDDPELLPVLQRFELVFVGGAGCPDDLLRKARAAGIRLAPCYGSTETAAMVTALDPGDFLDGHPGVGTAMPHARVDTDSEDRIRVWSSANAETVIPTPASWSRNPVRMDDLGEMDASGNLRVSGRADRVINSGGKKIHPDEVEAVALASGLVRRARCFGAPESRWGERVHLEVEPMDPERDPRPELSGILRERLPAWAVPRVIDIGTGPPMPAGWKESP
jgi:O-succinylbenzoic acid--CoA ligase